MYILLKVYVILNYFSIFIYVTVPEAPTLTVTPCTNVATGTKLHLTCESSLQGVEAYIFDRRHNNQGWTTMTEQEHQSYEVVQEEDATSYRCRVKVQTYTLKSSVSKVQTVTTVGKYK